MKRIMLLIIAILILTKLFSSQLVHSYYGDYHDIVRIVFVFNYEPFYNTLMDTDNKSMYISVSETKINPSILALNFSGNSLIREVNTEQLNDDVKITILTNVIYYAETFYLIDNQFKIVVDIFRKKEPENLNMANNYVNFFRTVGYHDRANSLQMRINNNEFSDTGYYEKKVLEPVPAPLESSHIIPVQISSNDNEINSIHAVSYEIPKDPLLYIKPDVTRLDNEQSSFINSSFEAYNLFKNIDDLLNKAEASLTAYDKAKTVDISFIETMSRQFNALSDLNIQLNQIRLELNSLNQRRVNQNDSAIKYTQSMINHLSTLIPDYHIRIYKLQNEYRNRLSN